jgi:NAD(P)H dehydrogenase (quinone)
VPAEDLVLLSRTPDNLAEFAERGAQVRRADFDDPASLLPAMEGGERMLLISTVRVGSRVEQHTAAVEAAKAQGVGHVVYTSLLGVRTPGNPSVEGFDHLATEKMIENSGLAFTPRSRRVISPRTPGKAACRSSAARTALRPRSAC